MAVEPTILPINVDDEQQAAHLTIQAHHKAADGSEYLREGDVYRQIVGPWAVLDRIAPVNRTERFGDVESWAAFVARFRQSEPNEPLLTWSEAGIRAILDYHAAKDEPGRCQFVAEHPFERTIQWKRWSDLANGRPRGQRELVEALEDNAEDVVDPGAGTLVSILRMMRATVNAKADTELHPDGSTKVNFEQSSTVKSGSDLMLPPEISIAIPVFKGHTDITPDGKTVPVRFALKVRLRVSVDGEAHLTFRLSMPGAEAALEAALADRVAAAARALDNGGSLLRATV